MSDLDPLLLRPQFHERVWGTRDLKPVYWHQITGNPVGEGWLTGDTCEATNGPFAGQTLAQLTARFGSALIGQAAPDASPFPLLTKFPFPTDNLSPHLHPAHETASP